MNKQGKTPVLAFFVISLWGGLFFQYHPILARHNENKLLISNPTSIPLTVQQVNDRENSFSCKEIDQQQDIHVEQCISEKYLILNQPISAAYNQLPDATYRYGSTQRGKRQIHHGIDIKNNLDTPVLAAEDGVVIVAGKDDERAYGPTTDFYGQLVIIRHDLEILPQPIYTLYGHLYHLSVKVGQKVKRGQVIGTVGMGGVAIGYHLHFEVRYGKNDYESTRNPELWLMPITLQNNEKSGVLSVRIVNSQGKPIQVSQIVLKKKEAAAGELPIYLNAYDDSSQNSNGVTGKFANKTPSQTNRIGREERLQEDFAIGGLQAGSYILSFTTSKVFNLEINIYPAKLTYLSISMNS